MKNKKKILSIIVKIALFFLMIYFVYYQLEAKGINYKDAFSKDGIKHSDNYLLFIGAILLMPVNWFLESYKWKTLISNSLQTNFRLIDSVKSVITGTFLGFVTPNRIGEFGGRLFYIKKGNKLKALSLAVRGGMAQFIVTFTIGLFSALFVYKELIQHDYLYGVLFFVLLLLIVVYFNFVKVVKFVSNIYILQKFLKLDFIEVFLSNKVLTKVFLVTLLRYLVYINQYVLICYFFSIDVGYLFLFSTISVMLLSQTIGPSFPLFDLPYRGGILLLLLEQHTDNQLNILFVILLVWILNLVLPAIIGYINFANLKSEVKNEKLNNNNNSSTNKLNA